MELNRNPNVPQVGQMQQFDTVKKRCLIMDAFTNASWGAFILQLNDLIDELTKYYSHYVHGRDSSQNLHYKMIKASQSSLYCFPYKTRNLTNKHDSNTISTS